MNELRTRPNAAIEAMLEEGDAWLSECSGPNPSEADFAPHPLAGLPLDMLEIEALEFDEDAYDLNHLGMPRMPFEPGL